MVSSSVDRVAVHLMDSYYDPNFAAAHTDLPFPDCRVIARVCDDLLGVLLPGYFGPGPNAPGFDDQVYHKLTAIRRDLVTQAHRAAQCAHGEEETPFPPNRDAIGARVDAFLRTLRPLRAMLAKDIEALFEADPAAPDRHEVAGVYPGVEAVATFRVAHELLRLGFPRIPRIMTELTHAKTGIDIHPGATIGPGFAIDHGTGVVVGETTVIGSNVRIYQGVTLGSLTLPRDDEGNLIRGPRPKRHPTLCDHVIVYSNASVLGGDTTVGAYTRIGANVRLTESVGAKMDVLVEGKNFWVRPRRTVTSSRNQAYQDRKALSDLASDGNPCCGEVDEIDWPDHS